MEKDIFVLVVQPDQLFAIMIFGNMTQDRYLDSKGKFSGHSKVWRRLFCNRRQRYICGGSFDVGSDYLYDLWLYNAATDTWVQKSNFPGGKRNHGAAFTINGKGYFGTGISDP